MALVPSVLRVKLLIFGVICFVLWQALRTVPSITSTAVDDVVVAHDEVQGNVVVTVFYEALCPDSRNFVTKQLLPTFEKVGNLLQVNLVPYGKAQTRPLPSGGYSFSCQHGPIECQANKIHACGIQQIANKDIALKYIACMISDNIYPEQIGQKCAASLGLDWEPIRACSAGSEGDELLKNYGEETHALSPSVSFIPTILLNGSQDNQAAILKNLLREVCKKMDDPKPVECS